MRYASATLGSGNIKQAVALPEGEDLNEWVAVNSESLRVCKVCVCTYVCVCDVGMRHLSSLLPSRCQPWTSSTRSTCSTGPSQSSAHRSLVQSCLLDQSESNPSITTRGCVHQSVQPGAGCFYKQTVLQFQARDWPSCFSVYSTCVGSPLLLGTNEVKCMW